MARSGGKSTIGNNRICQLLGIRYPIIQAPMNWVSGAEMVAAVSNAGGLGTLGPNAGAKTITSDVALTGERLRNQIRKVKNLTNKPFAVNITIGVREGRQYSQRCLEVTLEEGVPVVVASVGSPDVYTKILKDAGIKVLHAISTPRHAKRAEEAGVDGVICEGFEAGGHKGFTELTTFVLVPMVADAVKILIVAGGGIVDARGVLAALALGADAVYMGTRFMVTLESDAHPRVKEAVVRGEDACTVSIPKVMLCRDLRNLFTQKYLKMREAGASSKELDDFINEHSQYIAQVLGDAESSEVCCGQVAGLIKDVVTVAKVIEDITSRMLITQEELKHKLTGFINI
jgi:enoyl-[acyl-carrier protein] reductase II